MERLLMAKAIYILLDMGLKDCRILSIRNDGISVQPGKHPVAVRERMQKMIYGKLSRLSEQKAAPLRRFSVPPATPIETPSSSETLAFRVEVKPADMPGGLLALRDSPVFELPKQSWKIQSEGLTDDDFYKSVIYPHVIEEGRWGTHHRPRRDRQEHHSETPGGRLEGARPQSEEDQCDERCLQKARVGRQHRALLHPPLRATWVLLWLASNRRVQHAFSSSSDFARKFSQRAWR